MYTLDSVSCADSYGAANLGPAYQGSGGGYAAVTANDAYMQLSYGIQGQTFILKEMHVPVGTLAIPALPKGAYVQFRNYTPGSTAIVSGALAEAREPAIVLGASGIAAATATMMVTGQITSTGTITAGSGFSVVHTSTGVYTISFNTPFASPPTVLAVCFNVGTTAVRVASIDSTATGSCVVRVTSGGGAATDTAFNFVAFQTL